MDWPSAGERVTFPWVAITSNSGKVIIQKEGEMKRPLTVVAMSCFYCNQLILFSPNISTVIVGAIWSTTMRFFSSLQMIRYIRKSACTCLKSGSTSGRDSWSGKWVTLSRCEHNWAFKRLNSWCQEIKLKKKKKVGNLLEAANYIYGSFMMSSLSLLWIFIEHTLSNCRIFSLWVCLSLVW